MLAVVGEEPVAVFTEARARPADDLRRIKGAGRMRSDPNDLFLTEIIEGDLLDRTPDQAQGSSAVMDDATLTDVDPMMEITIPWCYQVCPEGWFFISW
jgi:hypothetical protein